MGNNMGSAMKENVWRTHGQSQTGKVQGWEVRMGGAVGHGGMKMETTVLK